MEHLLRVTDQQANQISDLFPPENWLEEHSKSPYHKSQISHYTHEATTASLICSDTVTLQLVTDLGIIKEVWHTTQGCLVAQASASFISQWSEGKAIEHLRQFTEPNYLQQLSPLTPMRQQCALLAFRCLQKALNTPNQYRQ